ncbi:MAG TPA: adenylate/guanylate cyclase domain-containing protein [Solirubrobacteraceae bacterium]|nr:adenylate/guanylate cyclase domain-containing protein [Solirubrobacteraceae bacterium]
MTETRYARNGDVSIAFQVVDGPGSDVLLVPSVVSQVEHLWDEPRVARMFRRLAQFSRLILFDRRGSGLSDRMDPPPLEQQMDDVRAVMRAAGSERAGVIAETEGTALATLFAATYPEQVTALALYAPIPRFLRAPDYPWAPEREEREALAQALYEVWGTGAVVDVIAPSLAGDARFRRWYAKLERLAMSPSAVLPMMHANTDVDVRALLPLIRAPTLVARRRDDKVVDARHAHYVADHVPGARFVGLPGEDNAVLAGDLDALLDTLEEFLTGSRPAGRSERVLATVLFTDICSSTERAAEMGDRRWRELLENHEELVREQLERFGGVEVKTLGDGFLATFDGPARAVRCALAIAEDSPGMGIDVRAGVHTGEIERVRDDVAGLAVNIAARVVAVAGPGEVLVSRTVTDLVAGSGLDFADRGTHELKGVPGEWPLFAAAG